MTSAICKLDSNHLSNGSHVDMLSASSVSGKHRSSSSSAMKLANEQKMKMANGVYQGKCKRINLFVHLSTASGDHLIANKFLITITTNTWSDF